MPQRKQMATYCVAPTSCTAEHCTVTPFAYLLGRPFLTEVNTLCLKNWGHVHLGVCFPTLHLTWTMGNFVISPSVVYDGIQVLTMPTFSVPPVSRKEESWVLQLSSNGIKWLIEINLKWYCGAQQCTMAIFIYLTILHASGMKRLPWEITLFYWLLF